MKRWLLSVALLLAGIACIARAQVPMTGAGKGVPVSGGGYTGPIDINGSAYAAWTSRCPSASYSGNIADIWDSATGSTTETLVTCSGGVLNTSSPTPIATTCGSGCNAKTIYDVSGGGNCSGACNLTAASNAARAIVTLSCQNGKFCYLSNVSGNACMTTPNVSTGLSQAYSITLVGNNIASGNNEPFWTEGANSSQVSNSTSSWTMYAGLTASATAAGNTLHAGQGLFNGSSSSWYIDGTSTTGLNAFTDGIGTGSPMALFATPTCSQLTNADIMEFIIWPGNKSANNATINSNQHTYWNF